MKTWQKVLLPTLSGLLVLAVLGMFLGREIYYELTWREPVRRSTTLNIPITGNQKNAGDYLAVITAENLRQCENKELVSATLTYEYKGGEAKTTDISFVFAKSLWRGKSDTAKEVVASATVHVDCDNTPPTIRYVDLYEGKAHAWLANYSGALDAASTVLLDPSILNPLALQHIPTLEGKNYTVMADLRDDTCNSYGIITMNIKREGLSAMPYTIVYDIHSGNVTVTGELIAIDEANAA